MKRMWEWYARFGSLAARYGAALTLARSLTLLAGYANLHLPR